MLSIPSPDVVVNLFASLGQLLALLTLVAGGAAVSGKRGGKHQRGRGTSRRLLYTTAGLAVASWVAFMLYYTHVQDATTARLRANLVRASSEKGKAVGDTSLTTLPLSGQQTHPLGLTTEALRKALESGRPLRLIDVRETEETERGRLPGSRHIRYPDLKRTPGILRATDATNVLVCYSGNRSSELCDAFDREGIRCQFLIGGYEKWIAEGGALEAAPGTSRRELRELPPSPNAAVLLDTPDAVAAVQAGACFVDVRYEEDFARGHLPNALNLPLRKLGSAELEQRIAALPKTPIIVPCYDKRSSFYALILALRVHRAGGTFVGRYTVPHEYPAAVGTRAHVAAWQAQQRGVTPLGLVQGGLAAALQWLQGLGGGLALAILGLVVLVRGLLSPLSFKADLDHWRRQRLVPEVRDLRERFAADPVRAQRATMDLYRRAGLTPLRNFVVSMGQLLLFLAFFGVIQAAAKGSTEVFCGWTLGVADPLGLLPVAVGGLMAAIICNGPVSRRKLALSVALGVFLSALTWQLSAAANLYLVASLGWVVVQGRFARARAMGTGASHRASRRASRHASRHASDGVVSLVQAALEPSTGNKAIRLGAMQAAGLPVPRGFAVTDRALARARRDGALSPRDRRAIARLHRGLKATRVAVRSSGLKEDGGEKSYAGVFESVLDVRADGLFAAIDLVRESMHSERAQAYGDGDEHGGIVVQAMVPAEYAGVLFTEHPGCSGTMLVELVDGLCEQLVGGTVTPKEFQYTRKSAVLVGEVTPPIDLTPLLDLARRVEALFGGPQDIEWAFEGGRFYLLQARDVTVRAGGGNTPEALRHRERARLLDLVGDASADEVVFAQNGLSELLPEPTPFSLALMNELWAPGGSVDLACRSMGLPYAVSDDCTDYAVEVFGNLYVNRREEARRLGKGLSGLASFRLTRAADALEREYRESVLPAFRRKMLPLEATDPQRLGDADLLALWRQVREEFITATYVEAERINIAADFFVKTASEQLSRRGQSPAAVLADIPATVVHRAFAMLPEIAAGRTPAGEFLALFGHRASHDFEISAPRYREAPAQVERMARSTPRVVPPARERIATAAATAAASTAATATPRQGRVLSLSLDRARRFQALKEAAKHEAMRELAVFRALTLEIARRTRLAERIFWLTPSEVAELRPECLRAGGVDAALDAVIEARIEAREACDSVDLPVRLTLADLEVMRLDDGPTLVRRDVVGQLGGKRVAGATEVIGRVRVVERVEDLESFVAGEVLVTRFTDPTWSTVFPIAGGLITEVGGWLSHAAIQAREYGLACIVDVAGAVGALETGDLVRLSLDGRVERIELAAESVVAAKVGVGANGGRLLRFGADAVAG